MSRKGFIEPYEQLIPFITLNALSPNYRALSVEKKVALNLYFSKDTGSITMTRNTQINLDFIKVRLWRYAML